MIKPTIGRVVWFWPTDTERVQLHLGGDPKQPLSAQISYVWNDRMVNIGGLTQNGMPFGRTSVLLMQGDESYTPHQGFCQWMPFQIKAAAEV